MLYCARNILPLVGILDTGSDVVRKAGSEVMSKVKDYLAPLSSQSGHDVNDDVNDTDFELTHSTAPQLKTQID